MRELNGYTPTHPLVTTIDTDLSLHLVLPLNWYMDNGKIPLSMLSLKKIMQVQQWINNLAYSRKEGETI
jgi:hypothetical protein